MPQVVHAAPTPLTEASAVRALAAEFGDDRTAGVYRNETGRLVIAVTDQATAQAVRAAGGVAEVVKYSTAALASIHTTFDERVADVGPIPNTSWGVDPSSNQVVIDIFDGVSAADEKRLRELAAGYGDAARIEELPGTLQAAADIETRGGIGIYPKDGVGYCTLGFNVRNSAGQKYFVTAGHCANTADDRWWNRLNGEHYLGKRIWWDYGGIDKDYAVMEYKGPEAVGPPVVAYGAVTAFGKDYEIIDSRYPTDTDSVMRAGAHSGDLVGEVLSPSVTVTYIDGTTLKNMIKTSLCVMDGDSGGPMWNGVEALGITSGGNRIDEECRSSTNDRVSYYQPVHWVLVHHGLHAF
ncbi:hypothetical protein Prum_094930 [Phytohabitans rumicis]|uniref:Serine protease n=2 Tax=Phytohabitans rumicis TaxID=1076125 RepID=A0A6V8LLI1_9ACTN|nr:hypothetical protein Prum_094930 [Phytohabitans rumicis]